MDISGIEFLKQEGLDKVSNKTFINQENLTYLLDKDFENLHQTKAIGFIQILEREYPIDLSELRSEYLDYIRVHKPKEQYLIIDEYYEDESDSNIKKYLPYALLLLGLGFALYMFSSSSSEDFVYQSDLNVVKNSTISQKAEENLLILAESNLTDENNLSGVVLDTSDKNFSVEVAKEIDSDLDQAVEQLFPLAGVADSNQSDTNDTNSENVVDVDAIIGADSNSDSLSDSQIYLRPNQKIWVGIFYLDTKKRKNLLVKDELKLDMKRDQLILTGHSNFKLFDNDSRIKVKSKNRIRFILQDGKLQEINKIEYNRYKKGE
jgi:hypothetical protein